MEPMDTEQSNQAAVELYLDDQISFNVLKELVGRQDAESIQASRSLLGQGEDLAEELAELSLGM